MTNGTAVVLILTKYGVHTYSLHHVVSTIGVFRLCGSEGFPIVESLEQSQLPLFCQKIFFPGTKMGLMRKIGVSHDSE